MKYLYTLAVPLAIGAGALAWVLNPSLNHAADVVYDTAAVTRGPIRKIVSTSGPVRALVTVSIGSQVSGQIDKVNVDYNSEVKTGDVLATLDARTLESRVLQAKADLASAQATLLNQEAALKKAQAVKSQTERQRDRQEQLQEKGYAATATLETARRDADVAVADITVAQAQIEVAKAGIAQREAALRQAQIDLERTKIVAPIEGTVISRTVDPGQTVAASLQAPELFKIAEDLRRIRIEAQVNEADVGAVAQGNPAQFTVDAYPDRTFKGKVSQVRLASTELQNVVTYTVIIEAQNEDRKLFPGMTANVQIEVAKKDDALRIPNDALRFKPRNAADQPGASANAGGGGGNRTERQVTRLKEELQLTSAQEDALRAQLAKMSSERTGSAGERNSDAGAFDPAAMRQKMQAAIEQTLSPILTDEQRPLFEKWRRGRENTKNGGVYVLDGKGQPDRRFVRLGIADDQFTEVAGGQLAEGDKVVLRAREAKK